jgi:hypothetical protein
MTLDGNSFESCAGCAKGEKVSSSSRPMMKIVIARLADTSWHDNLLQWQFSPTQSELI